MELSPQHHDKDGLLASSIMVAQKQFSNLGSLLESFL